MASSDGTKIKNIKASLEVFLGILSISFALLSYAQENSNGNNIFQDSDQDGLSDTEEKVYGTDPFKSDTDGDGYSDGAEIKSGYNPLKPAPGDKIIHSAEDTKTNVPANSSATNKKGNLTKELLNQTASLMDSKAKDGQNIEISDLDSIIDQSTGTMSFADLPEIDEKTIKIKKQDYSKLSETDKKAKEKKDVTEYMTALFYIMANNSPAKISEASDLENFSTEITSQINNFAETFSNASYFEKLANKGSVALEQIEKVEVPEKMLDLHIEGLKLLKYSVSLKDKYEINPDDPASAILALSEIQSLALLTDEFLQKINSEMKNYDINLL